MALALARAIVVDGGFDAGSVLAAYREWVRSEPFDVGHTVRAALREHRANPDSQANGSLMRVSPLALSRPRSAPRGSRRTSPVETAD